jgi:hypothetical protein
LGFISHFTERRVILDDEHTALMFISTKGFRQDQENRIKDIIKEEFGSGIKFVGRCFGKFDMIAEFEEASAKVASYKACNIQERATEMIQEERKSKEHPIGSSLVLCNEFLEPGKTERSRSNKLPIRFYSLFVPKNSATNLEEVLAQVKENMRLFFSSSYFTFLLVIAGNTFYNVFDDFTEFRENTKDFFSESSTHVAIDWKNEDKSYKDRKINANVLIKLKEGFGDIDDIKVDEFIKSINKRFGSFDISLLVAEGTLSEMKKKILKLRENRKISHTSTSLLMERENETTGK